jgi:exoribonuclease R
MDPDYKFLFDTTKQLSAKYKYISNIRNSHDIVCYLMILMNYTCAQDLLKSNTGIFRSTIMKNTGTKELPTNDLLANDLPEDVAKFIKIWNSSCGQYVDLMSIPDKDKEQLTKHDFLELDAYIHITSPIRRLVDLLNIIQFQKNHNLITLSNDADAFYKSWISQIDYINSTMRAIRKVQNDCNLLDMCYNDPKAFDKIYDGYCFDKITRNDGFYNYNVYLPELRITSKITIRDDLANYEKRQYKLYLFNNEEKFKKKIRLQLET